MPRNLTASANRLPIRKELKPTRGPFPHRMQTRDGRNARETIVAVQRRSSRKRELVIFTPRQIEITDGEISVIENALLHMKFETGRR